MKKHLITRTTLLAVILTLVILFIMPFAGIKGTSDTALALTAKDCTKCHTQDSKTLHHSLGLSCSTCHTFAWDPVTNSIKVSKITDCVVCHGSAGHEAVHDKALIDSSDCSECHASNVVVEHANHGLGCEVCHDGAYYQGKIDYAMEHVGSVYCKDCHGPTDHAANHDKAQIDSPDCLQCHDDTIVVIHAEFNLGCTVCHDGADYQAIIDNAMNTIGIVYCSDCHAIHHESPPDYTQGEEEICYTCHDSVEAQFKATGYPIGDTYRGLGTRKGYYGTVNTRHDVSDDDQSYSSTKIECINCHKIDLPPSLIDPDNGSIFDQKMTHPGTGDDVVDSITFCLKCHDGTWAPGVEGPKTIKNIATRYMDPSNSGGEQHGKGPGQGRGVLIGPYASVENGPVPAMPCTDCHDSHGGDGIYHLKTLTDQYGVPITITSENIGGNIVANWCSHCHQNPMNQLGTKKNNCVTSGCHSHGLNSTW